MTTPLAAIVLDAALKGAALLVIVACLSPLLRRRSAATRHAAWSLAIGVQLTLPALAGIAPAWRLPLGQPKQH